MLFSIALRNKYNTFLYNSNTIIKYIYAIFVLVNSNSKYGNSNKKSNNSKMSQII